jgi:hypothetical protein
MLFWREKVSQVTFEPLAKPFEHVNPNVLFTHLNAVQGRLGDPQTASEIPLRRDPTYLAKFLC